MKAEDGEITAEEKVMKAEEEEAKTEEEDLKAEEEEIQAEEEMKAVEELAITLDAEAKQIYESKEMLEGIQEAKDFTEERKMNVKNEDRKKESDQDNKDHGRRRKWWKVFCCFGWRRRSRLS